MIGVISKSQQGYAVEEFFELFKVPWEHCRPGKRYDVIVATDVAAIGGISARLAIISSSQQTPEEVQAGIELRLQSGPALLEHGACRFPVYNTWSVLSPLDGSRGDIRRGQDTAGYSCDREGIKIIRLGYDLFDEIEYLLSRGQAVEYAAFPTLDIHIAMVRRWIREAGIWLVEIPPCPDGYDFMTCLTHDVDFINIRDHKCDRSIAGFMARALVPRYARNTRGRISWSRVMKNWKALLFLPGVYLGLGKDFWYDIDRYLEIEKGLGTTYYFIPKKDHAGDGEAIETPKYRAAKYDVADYRVLIKELMEKGCEVGVHGIDAWHDAEKGRQELAIIRRMADEQTSGVRMHWLYFSERSPKALAEAGFLYDSSLGFNAAIGFRSGTTQAYRLSGTEQLLELPLHIMDTTLFSADRMSLSESEALKRCGDLVAQFGRYAGAITINWHTRSLSPERNWDDFYLELLHLLMKEKTWFATARQSVGWFRKRRSVRFDDVVISERNRTIRVKLSSVDDKADADSPRIRLRVHAPLTGPNGDEVHRRSYVDIPWSGDGTIDYAWQ